MAQQTSLSEEPRAGARRISPPASPAIPSSPTKSLWKRLLNRSASAHPEEPVKTSGAARPASLQPVSPSLPPPALESSQLPSEPGVDDDVRLPTGTNADGAAADCDGGAASKTISNSRRGPHRDVVPGLPRTQTFARQQSELRGNLLPTIPTPAERRGVSADRRLTRSVSSPSSSQILSNPRTSAPDVSYRPQPSNSDAAKQGIDAAPEVVPPVPLIPSLEAMASSSQQPTVEVRGDDTITATTGGHGLDHDVAASSSRPATSSGDHAHDGHDYRLATVDALKESHLVDTASMTSSQYEHRIHYELEHVWILNLSMHFRDKSRREKFFVTYRQRPDLSRRVTISLDYRNAPDGSLEMDLLNTKLQRDKNEMIYEAIRESLADIQFYNTVTNLKLQTTDGRLHVHVVEDTTEIIDYPSSQFVHHLSCRKIRESEVEFDSHMSGFVYKVQVHGRTLIKKEIPGPDSVDEFLYEVNALNFLRGSQNVIELYGVVVGDDDRVKGLLISYAEQGALIDIIYENNHGISWPTRMKWARQIVHGLSEIHEAGFVQGDFTLSNIVIDDDGNAKIIDINRRGCPVGWEPPEATPLIQSDQRISMYIGVKSDLYQLGMVLWALATQYDDPEAHGRPLHLGEDIGVPQWYRSIVETCLAEDPRERSQALQLLNYFPRPSHGLGRYDDSDYEDDWVQGPHHPTFYAHSAPSGSVDDGSNSFRPRTAGIESVHSVHSTDNHDENAGEDFTERERPEFVVDKFSNLTPIIRSVTPSTDWAYVNFGHTYIDASNGVSNEPYYYPTRGRSPPRDRTQQDMARRSLSWERPRAPDDRRPHSSGTWKSHDRHSRPPSVSIRDEAPLADLKDEADPAIDEVEAERSEPTEVLDPEESAVVSEATQPAGLVEESVPVADAPVILDGGEPEHRDAPVVIDEGEAEPKFAAEVEAEASVTETSALDAPNARDSKGADSKDVGEPNSPVSSSEAHYSLGNGALPLEASNLIATPKLETGVPDDNLLEQIKGVGAVYDEKYQQHSSVHDDEKKGAIDDQHDQLDNELTALATA